MLRFIKGAAGTGKSSFIRREIAKHCEGNEANVILLVPEQFSFETEREYYEFLGAERAGKVKVLSFMRLCDDVFRQYGGMAGDYATDTAKILTMRLALKECGDELRLYGKNAGKPDFVLSMLDTVEELKNAGITPEMLTSEALQTEAGLLKDKLFDLGLIYGGYDALLTQRFVDPSDTLSRAKTFISERKYFFGCTLYLDEFKSFTAVQKDILGLALQQANEVTVSLCLPDEEQEYGLFDGLKETEKGLKSLAYKVNCKLLPPVVLEKPLRFSSEALSHFAKEALKNNPLPFEGKNETVACVGLLNEFDEMEFVAAQIWELVQKDSYRFEDIVVIGRDLESYGHILQAAFDRYEIPCFFDRPESVETMPLIRFVSHLLGATVTNLSRKELLPMLKCGLMPVTLAEIDDFERYLYVWNVDKDGFSREFQQNPMGFYDRPLKKKELLRLKNAEKVRAICFDCVSTLRQTAEEKQSVSRALYDIMLELNIPQMISERIGRLKQEKRLEEAENEKRVWDILMEILDTLEGSLKGQNLNFREYKELFLLSAATYDLGRRPQTLDSVLVGSAERVRVQDKKAAILIGANDKVFPLVPSSGGLFSDRERQQLSSNGLELSNFTEQRLIDERFVAYKALTFPSEKLIITFSQGDISGREKYPSALVTGFAAIFPHTPVVYEKDLGRDFFCRNASTAFQQAAKAGSGRRKGAVSHGDAVFFATVEELLKEDAPYREKLRKLRQASRKEGMNLTDRSLCEELFSRPLTARQDLPRKLKLPSRRRERRFAVREQQKLASLFYRVAAVSPSQIERYYTCRFQYFCRYGLGLHTPQKAELNPLNRGNVIHYLLNRILEQCDVVHITEEELRRQIDRYLTEYLNRVMGGEGEKPQKFLYFYRRLQNTLYRIFSSLREEFAQTEFKVIGLEEPIRENGKVSPLHLPVDENHTVTVSGKVDRVDLYAVGEESFVRIIDYKSGGKEFDVSKMAEGLNLQMLLYLFAIWRTQNDKYKNVRPAGILYMPAGNPKPILERDATEEAQKQAEQKSYAMSGLLLNDERILCAMEKDLNGKFIPVSQGKNGLKGKYLATLKEFAALERYTESLVEQMGVGLYRGEISPDPVQAGMTSPCSYCDYRAICGHEPSDGCRSVPKRTMEDVIGAPEEQ